MLIGVVECGLGNVGSVHNMFKRIGARSTPVRDYLGLKEVDVLVLPGVGAFDKGMSALGERGLDRLVKELAGAGVPILGICLGMQLLLESSEEGSINGLGLIEGRAEFMGRSRGGLPIPHVGWATVIPCEEWGVRQDEGERFYFTHSYEAVCRNDSDVLAQAEYGGLFTAAVRKENLTGVQFHPEKSHRHGMRFLAAYLQTLS